MYLKGFIKKKKKEEATKGGREEGKEEGKRSKANLPKFHSHIS